MYYIDLVFYKTLADLRTDARRYYISYLWWIIEPLLDMLVYYLVFGLLLERGRADFIPFLLIGVISWKWFSTTVIHCTNSIISSKSIINQVNIPKFIFPVIVICKDTFKFFIVFSIVVIFVNFYGITASSTYMYIPFLLIAQLILILATGLMFAAITPFFPDIFIIISHALHLMFFCSGVLYDGRSLPESFQFWFYLNPMARFIEAYRDILMNNRLPDLVPFGVIVVTSIFLIIFVFKFIQHHDKSYPRIVLQ